MRDTAETRIVVCFTLIVAFMFGAWGHIDFIVTDPTLNIPAEAGRLVLVGIPMIITFVAYLAAGNAREHWAQILGSATVVLGVLTSLAAVTFYLLNLGYA